MGAGSSSQGRAKQAWATHDHRLTGPWHFLAKEKVQCVCEGGRWCTRENPAKQKTPNAIPGLHCSWVGDKVLAMARPWQENVQKFKLVEAFQQHNIGMILNLQEVGEHATCGPGNLPDCGFTYSPEPFMAGKIGFYNFSWPDMGVPNLDRMMDIVQVMDYVTRVEGRKVAVHCHAGLGRTGLAIACFFVFTGVHNADDAVKAVRKDRQGALQTSSQVLFVKVFEQYLTHLRCMFKDPSQQKDNGLGNQLAASAAAAAPKVPAATATAIAHNTGGQSVVLDSKVTGTSLTETYSSGLVLVRPLASAAESQPVASTSAITDHDLGLDQPLPWNEHFHIQPEHVQDFVAAPSTSYKEALKRQQRLLHGPERRAYLRLHKFVKEAMFTLISAARIHPPPPPLTPPSEGTPYSPNPPQGLNGSLSRFGKPSAIPGSTDAPNRSFAHALAAVIRSHGPAFVDTDALSLLLRDPGYQRFAGSAINSAVLVKIVDQLKKQLNSGDYRQLEAYPLLGIVVALEAFMANFADPLLSEDCLKTIAGHYQELWSEDAPLKNGQQQYEEAYKLLHPMSAPDQELLLVFSALLRIVVAASGPGCEDQLADIGRWGVTQLLGYKLAGLAAAEEALLSFLWYLLNSDVAYATLVLIKKQRLAGQLKHGISSPDISMDLDALTQRGNAMLAAAAARKVADSSALEHGQQQLQYNADATANLMVHTHGQDGYPKVESPEGSPHYHGGPALTPAEVAELLAQDVNDLYRAGFREAIGGISTVVYPPPISTGRVEVHDVWR